MTARVWTADEVRALGVRTDGVTACAIRYGVGRTKAHELLAAGAVDFPVIKVGRRYVVPVRPLLDLLGIPPETNGAGAPPPATATSTAPTTLEAPRDGNPNTRLRIA